MSERGWEKGGRKEEHVNAGVYNLAYTCLATCVLPVVHVSEYKATFNTTALVQVNVALVVLLCTLVLYL